MSSTTFATVNGKRVTVRTLEPERPTGLAAIGWKYSGPDVTVVIDGVRHDQVGSLMLRANGNYAWSLASMNAFCQRYNTLDEYSTGRPPYSYKTLESAFTSLIRFIKAQNGGEAFAP